MSQQWSMVYEKAIRADGSLYFPKKLTKEFLAQARKTMGPYLFANQYQNEIIPDGERTFKQEWFRYYEDLPKLKHTFCFIDPAISLNEGADYTGLVVADVDEKGTWYVRIAKRMRITPTQIVNLCFELHKTYDPMMIGIEEVAYQKSLLYFLDEEMKRRGAYIPFKGIKPPTTKTKEMRILSLVPRFENGHILMAKGLHDLEMELLTFPRAANDDISDALAYLEYIVQSPTKENTDDVQPSIASPEYEKWYIKQKRNPKKDLFEPDSFARDHRELLGD